MAKFCQKCGTELRENDTFCANCGNNINTNTQVSVNNGEAKSKIAAGLLGIFLGCFGVHYFYLGYSGKAVGQLLLTLLTCGILSPISALWGLIEGIMILSGSINTDAQGNSLIE